MGSSRSRAGNRAERRGSKRRNNDNLLAVVKEEQLRELVKPTRTILKPLTDNQRLYDQSIRSNIITFGTGPAGTGKTFYAVTLAAQELKEGRIEKLIVTRPMVEAGESMGFLPGELDEKFEPYLRPVRDALEECLGSGHLEYLLKSGVIEARPLAFLRGASLKNAFVIFDEAQNSTPVQMKMFLTRVGQHCKVVINGDMKQKDIDGSSGLADAVRRFANKHQFGHVHFTTDDIVRSGVCKTIVLAYEDDDAAPSEAFDGLKRILSV
jgi:phosphate starvation-inducible PhoH-like protein